MLCCDIFLCNGGEVEERLNIINHKSFNHNLIINNK